MVLPATPPFTGFRYLGNSSPSKMEVHDLNAKKINCQIGEIKAPVKFLPDTFEQAVKDKYNPCAYCIGGSTK